MLRRRSNSIQIDSRSVVGAVLLDCHTNTAVDAAVLTCMQTLTARVRSLKTSWQCMSATQSRSLTLKDSPSEIGRLEKLYVQTLSVLYWQTSILQPV